MLYYSPLIVPHPAQSRKHGRGAKKMSVFQALQKDIVDNVSLNALVPELNRESLLTFGEEQQLTNEHVSEYTRALELTSILRKKGPAAPSTFVRCLKREGGPGHAHLAQLIENYIATPTESQASLTAAQRSQGRGGNDGASNMPCSSSAATPGTHRYSPLPQQCSDPHQLTYAINQAHIEPIPQFTAHHSPSLAQPPSASHFPPPFEPTMSAAQPCSAATFHPQSTSHNSHSSGSQSLSASDPASAIEEHGGAISVSNQYSQMIGDLCTTLRLPPRYISYDTVAATLHAILHSHGISLTIPAGVASVPQSASVPFDPAIEEHGGAISVSNQYSQMIGDLCTTLRLPPRYISYDTVAATLHAILHSHGISLTIPAGVASVPQLLEFLRTQRMCHEYDVDLLCQLLKRLGQLDLHQQVRAYAQSIMACDVLHCGPPSPTPCPNQFLAFTIHNCPSLTCGQACEVKDVLSELLGLDRHTFWLSSSGAGSVVLGWSFREEVSKHVHVTLEEKSTQSKLLSNVKMHHLMCIETGSQVRHTIVSTRSRISISRCLIVSRPADTEPTSSVSQSLSPAQSRVNSYSLSQPPSFSLPSFQEAEEKEEEGGVVSSTTADLPSPDVHQSTTKTPQLYVGAKRKLSADSSEPKASSYTTEYERASSTERDTIAGQKRHSISQADQPSSKRKALSPSYKQTERPKFRDTTPKVFSEQYLTPSFSEPAYRLALMQNQPFMVQNINLMSLLPHLNAHSLLSDAENQEMQMGTISEYNRILKLLTALVKKGEDGFRKFISSLKQASDHLSHRGVAEKLEQYLPHPAVPTAPSSTPIATLINHLRAVYTHVQVIRLALVKKQGVSEEDRWKDKFLKATLHGHVEDIVKKKVQLDMDRIFQYGRRPRKLVLVEGAPGVGKTMLAMKLCEQWARDESLREYNVVLSVELRRFQGELKLKLENVVHVGAHLDDDELTKEVVQYLVRTGGEGLLIILEGWDELSPKLRREYSLFFDLVTGRKLPKASIMVTSRPSVTAPLYDYMDERRVEVLGFSEEQQNEYIKSNVPNEQVAQKIRDHLKQFPNLRALAHIPLTLAIICWVATESFSLPETLTKLYDKFTCILLFQSMRKNSEMSRSSLIGLDSLDEIPEDARAVFRPLCKLALQGFERSVFIFESRDLEEVGLPSTKEGFDAFGLLSTPLRSATAGHKLLYQFRHLSMQEFLAALEISKLPVDTRKLLLTKYRSEKQFRNVWKFLAGITKLEDEAFRDMIINLTRPSSRDQLFLLHCLYEAQNPEICKIAAEKIYHNLRLDNTSLNATDCLCAAYMLGSAEGEWEVNLRGCNIGGDGLEVIKWQLKDHDSPFLKIANFDIMHNHLEARDVHHLTEMLTNFEAKIVRIDLGSNRIGDEGVIELAATLKTNSTVEKLHFTHCNLTSESARALAEVLKCNCTLKDLYFGFEPLGDEGAEYLASGLKENKSLEELSVSTSGISGAGVAHLAEALKVNTHLKVIRFDRNDLKPADCKVIAEMLAHNETLGLIDLSKNPIGDEGFELVLDALIAKPATLTKLGAYGCGITSKGLEKLVTLFRNTDSFKGIQLGLNALGDDGAEFIAEAVRQNKSQSVKDVYLESTSMSPKAQLMLQELSQTREDLNITFSTHASLEKMRRQAKQKLQQTPTLT